uniref:NADH dehydrogenase subunit 2 n=1 Tax=Kalanchoe fedtschenkoi TaxID=63787 RepID=A0A7N0UUQ5_KALFE
MFNLFLAVSPEIFIINATSILLIHGVVFSTSKKYDYPPLVSNVGWLGLLSVSNNLASARRWRTSPNYCPFILE